MPHHRTDGVMLQFVTLNFIRAGGNNKSNLRRSAGTHGQAFLSCLRFSRFATTRANEPLGWIGAAGAPNIVLSGTLKGTVKDTLKNHHRVSHSSKFPGIAVHTGGDTCFKATPEVFASGKFIMPGIKSHAHAAATADELALIVKPHLTI